MAEIEQLSLYCERDDAEDVFYVKNYPEPGARTAEHAAVETLTSAGWRLVSMAPTRAHRYGHNTSRVLNLERITATRTGGIGERQLRLHRQQGRSEVLRGSRPTAAGYAVTASTGLVLKFLGITRLVNGAPDYALLGQATFTEDVRTPFTGVISVNGARTTTLEHLDDDIYCQFIRCALDGSYHDDVHQPEVLALRVHGLMVGVPFGETYLEANVPFRRAKFEYVVFRGSRELGRASEVLVRFRFEVVPR